MITEKHKGFEICLTAEEEDVYPSDHIDFETKEQEKEYLEKIDNGELGWFCAKAAVKKAGIELAASYLGCCDYPSLKDFKENGGYYEDMRDEAVEEAEKIIVPLRSNSPKEIVIEVRGGVVQSVSGIPANVSIRVIDYDNLSDEIWKN